MEFDEEFSCPVCRDLMVQPVMLHCGHNLCYLCLARSSLASGTRTCPTCQQPWQGFPHCNLALRNMMARMHREYMAVRESTLNDPANIQTVMSFKANLEAAEKGTKDNERGQYVLNGIAIALCVVLIPYIIYHWIVMGTDPVTQKPVMTWQPPDVVHWLETMTWTRDYTPLVHLHQIDGPMLMGMEEMGLLHLLNVTDVMHQHAIQMAIRTIRENGVKMPENLWDYMAVYPGRTYFLSYCLIPFPRASILLMYLFYYKEMFVPFVQTTTPVEWGDVPETQWGKVPDLKTSQKFLLGLWTLVLPFWKILVFVWAFRWQHYIFLVPVLIWCIQRAYSDISFWKAVLWRKSFGFWQLCFQEVRPIKTDIWLLLWPVLPQFVITLNLYTFLLVNLSRQCILTFHAVRPMVTTFYVYATKKMKAFYVHTDKKEN